MVTTARKNHCTRCDRFSYFKLEDGICGECRARVRRIQNARKRYANRKWTDMDIINLYWRNNFSRSEIAYILDETTDTIRFAIDRVRLNAR